MNKSLFSRLIHTQHIKINMITLKFNKIKAIALLIIALGISDIANAQNWVKIMLDSTSSLQTKTKAFDDYWSSRKPGKGTGYKQFKRNQYFLENRVNEDGRFEPTTDIVNDYEKIEQQLNSTKAASAAGKWIQLGPFGPATGSGSGRINCIDFHPSNANIILVGAPSGGIWRSVNGGNSWTTNTDNLASIGISDIQFAPSNGNIVYAATGDRDGGDTYTHGILKSTDAGIHWTLTNWAQEYRYRRQTYRLLVHPNNPDIVYATTSIGLYKTTDGGQNWTRIRIGAWKDIAFKPNDPNTIYIASANTVAKSTNGGTSFTNLSFQASSTPDRLEIAVTPNAPNYLYVLASKSSTHGFGGLYLSTNAGGSFTQKASTPNLLGWKDDGSDIGGQSWYDMALEVSPYNKNIVFVGGVNIWRSTNAGQSWSISGHWRGSGAPYVHADIHTIKYSPHNQSTLWACTDGGLSLSASNGSQWTEKNNHLAVAQMYRLGNSKTLANKVITGWQDNGTNLMNTSWHKVLGGDGMECIISNDNNNILFGSLYYGSIRRSLNGGSSWSEVSSNITEEGAWVTPFVQHPSNANILYAGYRNVWKTMNKGNSWTKISNFSDNNKLNTLATAPSNVNIIWAANSSNLYKTTNGGNSWTLISNGIGNGSVNSIAIDANNPNTVWICKSGFYAGNKVYKTTNGGNSWTNISGNLPNYPANTIVKAENTANAIYVGMDIGVYYRDDILGQWVPFMKDLPNVIVDELEIFEQGHKIRAATFGRGLWESLLYPYANSLKTTQQNTKKVRIFPNPAEDVIYINFFNFNSDNIQLSVFDNVGREVIHKEVLNSKDIMLSTSQLRAGIYYLRIVSNSYTSANKIVIK